MRTVVYLALAFIALLPLGIWVIKSMPRETIDDDWEEFGVEDSGTFTDEVH